MKIEADCSLDSVGTCMFHHVNHEDAIAPDNWVPASGGTETPFKTRTGRTLLYCWQPSTGTHAYLDCGTDMILTDDEARQALATY